MLDRLHLQLGALVAATDGVCGLLHTILVSPPGPRVAHIVVEPEHRIGLGRLVSLDLVSAVYEDANFGLDLDCDLEGFNALPYAESMDFLPGPGPTYRYARVPLAPVAQVRDLSPEGEGPLRPEAVVRATDGEVGHVAGLVTGPPAHQVAQVLVNLDQLFWRHRTVAVPIEHASLATAGVALSLSTEELRDLARK